MSPCTGHTQATAVWPHNRNNQAEVFCPASYQIVPEAFLRVEL